MRVTIGPQLILKIRKRRCIEMQQCIRCGFIKYWFQFFIRSVSDCDLVARSDVCKSCANILTIGAVRDYEKAFKEDFQRQEMLERVRAEDG